MPLQVRLVHTLGDRLLDLPERPMESALVVGRATDADVSVPVVTVSRRQAVMWVRDGQWLIQDAKGGAGTRVNGQPASGPTLLQSGDVVTLGPDASPPTLVIDPFGIMAAEVRQTMEPQTMEPQPVTQEIRQDEPAAHAAAPAVPPAHAGLRKALPPQPRARMAAPAPVYVEGNGDVGAQAAEAAVEGAAEAGADDWMTAPAAAARSQRYYVPQQNTWTPAVISTVIFGGLAIAGITWYIVSTRQKAADEAFKVEQRKVVEAQKAALAARPKPTNIFDMDAEQKQAVLKKQEEQRAAKTKITSVDNAAAQDPGRQTEAWKRVEDWRSSHPPKDAIVMYDAYLKANPSTPYVADLRKYTDEALDAIWWERIGELVQERADITVEIKQKNSEIAASLDADLKKTLADEKAPLEEHLAKVNDQLKEMNYLAEAKPVLENEALMGNLRRSRNAQMYEDWKARAEKRIIRSPEKSVWNE